MPGGGSLPSLTPRSQVTPRGGHASTRDLGLSATSTPLFGYESSLPTDLSPIFGYEEDEVEADPKAPWSRRRVTALGGAISGLVFVILALAAIGAVAPTPTLHANLGAEERAALYKDVSPDWTYHLDHVEGPEAGHDDPEECSRVGFLDELELVQNNLGESRSHEKEGMIFKAVYVANGVKIPVHLELHALWNMYYPAIAVDNGLNGKFMKINLKPGTSVTIRASLFEAGANGVFDVPVELPFLALTFFDLDTGLDGTSVERVSIGGFEKAYVSHDTTVAVSDSSADHGIPTFAASERGDGEDNPQSPETLTQEQRSRAVTLAFKNVRDFQFRLEVTGGRTYRYFFFSGRPTLLCSIGSLEKLSSTAVPSTSEQVVVSSSSSEQVVVSSSSAPADSSSRPVATPAPHNARKSPENGATHAPVTTAAPSAFRPVASVVSTTRRCMGYHCPGVAGQDNGVPSTTKCVSYHCAPKPGALAERTAAQDQPQPVVQTTSTTILATTTRAPASVVAARDSGAPTTTVCMGYHCPEPVGNGPTTTVCNAYHCAGAARSLRQHR